MSFSFGIIGAGWYGCHIASSFKALGFDVTVFEAAEDIFSGASGHNQFRLHQGFHYARNYRTRVQSRDGFMRFLERYPSLSEKVQNNLYAVPDHDSLIDFVTYRLIMTSSGIEFKEGEPKCFALNNCSGALLTDERVILTSKVKGYFKRRLHDNLRLGEPVASIRDSQSRVYLNGQPFDYVVDATWGGMSHPGLSIFFEPTLLLYYRLLDGGQFALTLVDGQLCSVYPTEDISIYTLSSVAHTPIARCSSMVDAVNCLSRISSETISAKRRLMENQIRRYLPGFSDRFEFVAPQLSIKTKLIGADDDRSCYVFKSGRRFSIMSGKIDTIFFAAENILSMIESENEMQVDRI